MQDSLPSRSLGAATDLSVARLRQLVTDAVAGTTATAILLSGGLDTSILAALATSAGRRLDAISVAVSDGPCADEPFATAMTSRLGMELRILRPSLGDLLDRMPDVIRTLGTFDPMELRNSVVTYLGLREASERCHSTVMTGDAADELFAGYSFMFNMNADELPAYIRYLNHTMHFTSIPLAASLGGRSELPYLAAEIRDFAQTLSADHLVVEMNGQRLGKRILREAFSDLLPAEIVWRRKTPIEYGCGSTALQELAGERLTDSDFESIRGRWLRQDGVKLRGKEQCLYYQIYRESFPPPSEQAAGAKRCGECHGPVTQLEMRYCRICGAYPV